MTDLKQVVRGIWGDGWKLKEGTMRVETSGDQETEIKDEEVHEKVKV